jgi:hypothetical protein
MVATLKNIGEALKRGDGSINDESLRLRLAEQYVKTLQKIYEESKVVVLPKQAEGGAFSTNSLAQAVAVYNSMQWTQSYQ